MTRPSNALPDIEVQPDIGITMPDNCRPSAIVFRPVDAADDPAAANLEYSPYRKRDDTRNSRWTQELSRNGIKLRTETSCQIWPDRENLFLKVKINAFKGETLVISKPTEDSAPRNQM